jgi:hypothetical protein
MNKWCTTENTESTEKKQEHRTHSRDGKTVITGTPDRQKGRKDRNTGQAKGMEGTKREEHQTHKMNKTHAKRSL